MRRLLVAFSFILCAPLAHAWNAAGHRLVAIIAWEQLSPPTRDFMAAALQQHPDHEQWQAKARSARPRDIFAEAATWPDDIRRDARFYDEEREAPTPPQPGFPDLARHKRWHYVDLDRDGKVLQGELDRQIERLTKLLRSTRNHEQISYALPWLMHLVADIHQPLHVGRHDDDGGNAVEVENPFNRRQPFTSLHTYWDDLPGPPWLRGKRLERLAAQLLASHSLPPQGTVQQWRGESHRLLPAAYPQQSGSLLPIIDEEFHRQARATADQRIVDAGYRLGRLLEASINARVSRETQ